MIKNLELLFFPTMEVKKLEKGWKRKF